MSAGAWRRVEPDEIFEPGRHFRVDVSSGQREVREPDGEAGTVTVAITFFRDFAATYKEEKVLDLADLTALINTTTALSKGDLPWLKLARFGDKRSDKGSLRHNGNIFEITGLEGDYDGEEMSFDAARDTLIKAGMLAILYTSPSHTEDSPRWRVAPPFSTQYPPETRDMFMARLNGLFGGVFSRESWTLSQSYYFGSVKNNPSHRVELIPGTPIDLMPELDAGAIGKPGAKLPNGADRPDGPVSHGGAAGPAGAVKLADARVEGFIVSLLDTLRRDAVDGQKHFALLRISTMLGGIQAAAGFTDAEAWGWLKDCLPSSVLDINAAEKTAIDGLKRGRARPIALEDRPLPANGTASPFGVHRQVPEAAEIALELADDPPSDQPGDGQDAASREPYGPPTLDDLTTDDLAAMDELVFARIVRPKAALSGVTVTALARVVARARGAARAEARAAEKAARAAGEATAKAARAEARSREKEAKATKARARLNAQKTPRPLTDDDDDPLRDWIPPDPDTVPEIIVAGGERPAIADAAQAAMKAAGVPFYQRGKDLVRVCLINLKRSSGKTVRVPAISPVTRPMLLRAMGLTAKWLAFNRDLDLVRIDPPGDLADHILGMIGEWPFPPLRGVVATQTMRHDGTLLIEPGYDKATGLVLFNPPKLPDDMPLNPTKADAMDCLALFKDLLSEVAFAKDNDVSLCGAISMIMTLVLRGMMEVAPLHIVNKPAPNSGGSYLQDIAAAIAIGGPCPVISLTLHNDEENEKRLSAAALSGQPIIAIDNMVGTLMGSFLCQLVERPMPQVRLLGKSELVTIDNNHSVLGNGNNVGIAADMVRRTLRISLDANIENPETRVFKRNPVTEIMVDRGRYIAAAMTIARAYRLAGMPDKLTPRNSFEDWSDNVRSALRWLGLPDCDESIKAVRAADPAGAQLHGVITAWAAELIVGIGYRTSELVELASQYVYDTNGVGSRARPALWDALFAVAADKTGKLDPRALGRWLEDHLNRVVGAHKLVVDRADKSRPRWSLEPP